MGDVLAALGMCLGGMSFILNTVPAAVKLTQTFKERRQQVQGFELRLSMCHSKYNTWRKHWAGSKMTENGSHLESCFVDVAGLASKIDKEISRWASPMEKKTWNKMKIRLGQGIFRRPKSSVSNFGDAIRFALWNREILEAWMTRLEKTIKVIDELFEQEFHTRTADHFSDSFNIGRVDELHDLEEFAGNLMSMAKGLYEECLGTPNTCAWGLGLQSPADGASISNWKIVAPVTIELGFSTPDENPRHFQLHVCYKEDNPATHTTNGAIGKLILAKAAGNDGQCDPCDHVKLIHQEPFTRRTSPLGSLLKSKPHLFKDVAWFIDRDKLIHGLSEWALLLWDTPWFDKLCCDGLVIETGSGASSTTSRRQIFNVTAHDECDAQQHKSRLKNLGIVWAQLILGKPIRSVMTTGSAKNAFEQLIGKDWTALYLSDINGAILGATGSLLLQKAVDFCLKSESRLAKLQFMPGHLFKYIDCIYNPLSIPERQGRPHADEVAG